MISGALKGLVDRIAALRIGLAGRPALHGDTSLPVDVARALSEDVRARLRASQVDAVLRVQSPLMVVNIVNALALLHVLQADGQNSALAIGWVAVAVVVAAWQLHRNRRARRKPAPERTSERTVRRLVRSALGFGCLWAVPGLLLMPVLQGFSLAFSLALLTGMIAGGAFALYPVPAAALAFMAPVTLGGVIGLAGSHGVLALGPALIAVMFLAVFIAAVKRHADLFVTDFLTRLELERRTRLIEDLLEDTRLELLGSRRIGEDRLVQAKKVEAIGLLTSGIAHDFNNLLTVIRGNAELLELQGGADAGLLGNVIDAADRGGRQVQRLLSVAQKQMLQPGRVDLAALLGDLGRVLEASLAPSHRIEVEILAGTPAPFVDAAQLENSLVNLVFNARDAMPAGGVIGILCRPSGHDAGSVPGAGGIAVSVIDTGRGMDVEVLTRATDPFFTTKRFGQGSGLGLSCVAGFVGQSGGTLSIDSVPDSGTTVTMHLPVGPPRQTGRTPKRAVPPPEAAPRRVLLVEDTAEVRTMTAEMLRRLGYEPICAASAETALSWLGEGQPVDLVLTDILLTEAMTGLQLARRVRDLRPGLPVVFISAMGIGQLGGGLGAAPILPKPFGARDLSRHVARALQIDAEADAAR